MMNYDSLLAHKAKGLKPSGIRRFFSIAAEMEDCIALGVGEPDFKTPWSIREAGIQSLEKGKTWYSANAGLIELRKEICKYLSRRFDLNYNPDDQCIVTVGGSEAIDLAMRAIINPGDEIIIPEPCFVCYSPIVELCGGVPVPVALTSDNGFRLTGEQLKSAITDKTKMVVLPFPSNPTGAVMRREHLQEIADVLKDTNILALSDEIYAELTYGDERHVSIASIEGMAERTIYVNGFSKAYAMTGWRLGYVCAPKELIEVMLKIHQFGIMSAPSTSQYAAITALKECDDEIEMMRSEYDARRRYMVSNLNRLGLTCFDPDGAFYVFPCIKSTGLSSEDFCMELLQKQRVAVIPGSAFGESGEGYVRISYSYSTAHLMKAIARIEQFIKELEEKNGAN